jgi:hypothetical protein
MSSSGGNSNNGISVSYDVLQLQNADTTNAILDLYQENTSFQTLSQQEGQRIQIRDAEDDEKLNAGIQYAQRKGVIDPNYVPEPYVTIDVYQQTPSMVANTIVQYVHNHQHQHQRHAGEEDTTNYNNHSNDNQSGYAIVLVGLSGTGKGTTVTQLVSTLQTEYKAQVMTWSNGNLFRTVTLLATSYWEQLHTQQANEGEQRKENENEVKVLPPFDKDVVLTKENLETFMNMLTFDKHPTTHAYDIKIQGLHYDNVWVSDIQNTLLKSSTVSKHIPTVAEVTQACIGLYE